MSYRSRPHQLDAIQYHLLDETVRRSERAHGQLCDEQFTLPLADDIIAAIMDLALSHYTDNRDNFLITSIIIIPSSCKYLTFITILQIDRIDLKILKLLQIF